MNKTYNINRLKKLEHEFKETNLNSQEIVSSEYRKEINKNYKSKQDIFLIDKVLYELSPSTRRMVKEEVYQICSSVRLKDLCYNCKVEEIISIVILYVWRTRYKNLREDQTRLWRVYELSWRKYSLVLGRLLQKHRENTPISNLLE